MRRYLWSSVVLGLTALLLNGCDIVPVNDTADVDVSGTYTADIPYRDFEDVPGQTLRSFAGRWTVTLDEDASSYRIEGEGFSRVSGYFSLEDDVAVFDDEPAPKGAFNCYIEDARTLTEGRATYEARVEDGSLALEVDKEPCPLREAILEREWVRSAS